MNIVFAFVSNAVFNFVIGLLLARYLGPDEYGRFAIAVAIGVAIQTVAFDWIRLAAARFFSARVRSEQPALRSTLDTSLALLILILLTGTGLLLLSTVDLPLSAGLTALATGTAVANGVFDYQAALLRAQFLDAAYARLVIGKNLLSLALTVGGAFWFGSAKVALAGVVLSMAGSLGGTGAIRFSGRRFSKPDGKLAGQLYRYALPIVLANLLYQSIPLVDRLVIARTLGFAQSGHFSFAYDIGVRLVAAIGSMLDVVLFQLAVRADEIGGAGDAKRQIGENVGIVIAVLTPACVGCWLVLPSFEQIVAPAEFQGTFRRDFAAMLPGFYAYGLIFFALHPSFQISKKTSPLFLVAALASVANGVMVALFSRMTDTTLFGIVLSASLVTGLVLLAFAALRSQPILPRFRDIGATLLGTGCMAAAVLLLPAEHAGPQLLSAQAGLGAAVYAALAYALDLCGLRARLRFGTGQASG